MNSTHVDPDSPSPYRALAGTYSELGRDEEARAELAELFGIEPKFSLQHAAKAYKLFKNQEETERFVDALRKAGLK